MPMSEVLYNSNNSAATQLYVAADIIDRSGTRAKYRFIWQVTTGSSWLGNNVGNYRYLGVYLTDGTKIAEGALRKATDTWNSNSTYSGQWESWIELSSYNAGNANIYYMTNATGTNSCIWSDRSKCYDTNIQWGLWYTNASPATGLSVTPNYFEDTVTFSWSPAAGGTNNDIVEYFVKYRYAYGAAVEFGGIGKATSVTRNLSDCPRGAWVDFTVRAITVQGDSPYSVWSSIAYRNSAPYTPTNASVPQSSYIPGNVIRVSFTNNGDPDGNADHIELYSSYHGAVILNAAAGASYVDVDTTGWPQGMQTAFKVRLVDVRGVVSSWSNNTATVTLNTAPNAPSINYPLAGAVVYNHNPHVLLTAGVANDGPQAILVCADYNTRDHGSYFSCGTTSQLASSRKLVMVPGAWGAHPSFNAYMHDGFLNSSVVSDNFYIYDSSFTDPTITPGVTKCMAVHITELQNVINTIRNAYGIADYAFEPCIAGQSMIGNAIFVNQLQSALQTVISAINAWDTASSTFDISVTWISPATAGGEIDATKLRQAIEQLRSTILLI